MGFFLINFNFTDKYIDVSLTTLGMSSNIFMIIIYCKKITQDFLTILIIYTMKKIIFLSTLFFSLVFQAQVTIKPGVYRAEGENKGVELYINEDNSYQVTVMSGKLISKNDSIYLESKYKQDSKFTVNQFENNKNSSAIIVTVNSKYIASYYNPVYIGTQKNDKSPIEYKYLEDYKPQTMDSTGYETEFEDIVFSLDRVKYIYLVETKDAIATTSKYEIKDSVSNLEIIYSPYAIYNVNLRGYVTDENKLVITDGNSPIIFSLNSDLLPVFIELLHFSDHDS